LRSTTTPIAPPRAKSPAMKKQIACRTSIATRRAS
jgi:hypothetical protein